METNELVQFLEGRWNSTSVLVDFDQPMQKKNFKEVRRKKGQDTLTVSATDVETGLEINKDIQLIVRGGEIKLRQGSFMAKGKKHGNMYLLEGNLDDKLYKFRLYVLDDKFVFHREVWSEGRVISVDINCLERSFAVV